MICITCCVVCYCRQLSNKPLASYVLTQVAAPRYNVGVQRKRMQLNSINCFRLTLIKVRSKCQGYKRDEDKEQEVKNEAARRFDSLSISGETLEYRHCRMIQLAIISTTDHTPQKSTLQLLSIYPIQIFVCARLTGTAIFMFQWKHNPTR